MTKRNDYEKCNAVRDALKDPAIFVPGGAYTRREMLTILRRKKIMSIDEELSSLPSILGRMGWLKNRPRGGKGMTWLCPNPQGQTPAEQASQEPAPASLLDDVKEDTRDIRAIVTEIHRKMLEARTSEAVFEKRLADAQLQMVVLMKRMDAFFVQMGVQV